MAAASPWVLAGLLSLAGGLAQAQSAPWVLKPCQIGILKEQLLCGELPVPENPLKPRGREIKLRIVVVPAINPDPAWPPLFDLDGGPGLAATVSAGFYVGDGAIHRQHRDVVLVDQRGTGQSGPLRCQELEEPAPLADLYPPDIVRQCRRALEQQADLSQYTTANAAADLDAVRAALHYEKIDLAGLSYGTRLALTYMRLYPQRVRSAVLIGTVNQNTELPLWHARNAQATLDEVLSDCAADAACKNAYPELPKEWGTVQAAVQKSPVVNTTLDDLPIQVKIAPGPFAEAFRGLLYSTLGQRELPMLIHEMSQGDFDGFLDQATGGGASFAEGLYLSLVCAEDTPRITAEERTQATAGTFLGAYRIDRQLAACREWNVPPASLPDSRKNPNLPVLFVAGDRDAVTPLAWAREVAKGFPRSRVLVFPKLGHSADGLENLQCLDALIDTFYSRQEASELDVSCIDTMTPPGFAVPEEPQPAEVPETKPN